MLTKVNDSGVNDKYLNINLLKDGNLIDKVAYLTATRTGTAVNSQGFVRFYFKDVNGYTISGPMFDMGAFLEQGFTLSALKRRPVIVKAYVQNYMGSLSLLVKEIEPYNDHFDYDLFLPKIENASNLLETANKSVMKLAGLTVKPFTENYAINSYLNICDGRAGGFAKLLDSVIASVFNISGTPGVEVKDLFDVLRLALNAYARYLEYTDKVDVTLNNYLLNLAYNSAQSLEDERLKSICVDSVASLLGLSSPEHLYSHIIFDSVKTNERLLNMSYMYPVMMTGSSKEVGGLKLAKY